MKETVVGWLLGVFSQILTDDKSAVISTRIQFLDCETRLNQIIKQLRNIHRYENVDPTNLNIMKDLIRQLEFAYGGISFKIPQLTALIDQSWKIIRAYETNSDDGSIDSTGVLIGLELLWTSSEVQKISIPEIKRILNGGFFKRFFNRIYYAVTYNRLAVMVGNRANKITLCSAGMIFLTTVVLLTGYYLYLKACEVSKNSNVLMNKVPFHAVQLEVMDIDIGYVTIKCQKYLVDATKHKTPIIFIHGGPGYEAGYIINLKKLAQDRPCIFYDQSGCGKSIVKDGASIHWTLEHYVHELEMVMSKLGLKNCILYGFSWGAAIAMQYTLEHPEHVERLILASPYLSTSHLVDSYKQLALSKGIYETMLAHEQAGTTASDEYQNARKTFFSNFVMLGKEPSVFENLTFNAELSDIMWGPSELVATGTLKDMNLIPRLHKLRLPVLLTSGFYDPMTPEYMRLLRNEICDSKWVLFQDSAHMTHLEEEDEYCSVLQKFLSDVTI